MRAEFSENSEKTENNLEIQFQKEANSKMKSNLRTYRNSKGMEKVFHSFFNFFCFYTFIIIIIFIIIDIKSYKMIRGQNVNQEEERRKKLKIALIFYFVEKGY